MLSKVVHSESPVCWPSALTPCGAATSISSMTFGEVAGIWSRICSSPPSPSFWRTILRPSYARSSFDPGRPFVLCLVTVSGDRRLCGGPEAVYSDHALHHPVLLIVIALFQIHLPAHHPATESRFECLCCCWLHRRLYLRWLPPRPSSPQRPVEDHINIGLLWAFCDALRQLCGHR